MSAFPENEIRMVLDRIAPLPESISLWFQTGLLLLGCAAFALTFARRGWASAVPAIALAAAALLAMCASLLHPAARERGALSQALCAKAAESIAAAPAQGRDEVFLHSGCGKELLAEARAGGGLKPPPGVPPALSDSALAGR